MEVMKKRSSTSIVRPREWLQIFLQATLYILISRPLRWVYHAERAVPSGMYKVKQGALFVSNHQSMADPFLVLVHIPTKVFFQSLPFYFPVSSAYYRRWYLRPFIAVLGGYDIGGTKTEKMLGLLRTRALLKQKRTVFLFPEGKINKKNIGDFERGIEFFVKDCVGGVIFVQMRAFSMSWSELIETRPQLKFSEVYTFHRGSPRAHELQSLMQDL